MQSRDRVKGGSQSIVECKLVVVPWTPLTGSVVYGEGEGGEGQHIGFCQWSSKWSSCTQAFWGLPEVIWRVSVTDIRVKGLRCCREPKNLITCWVLHATCHKEKRSSHHICGFQCFLHATGPLPVHGEVVQWQRHTLWCVPAATSCSPAPLWKYPLPQCVTISLCLVWDFATAGFPLLVLCATEEGTENLSIMTSDHGLLKNPKMTTWDLKVYSKNFFPMDDVHFVELHTISIFVFTRCWGCLFGM